MTSEPNPAPAHSGESVPAPPMRTERTAGVVRASGMMAVATLVSRATGFVSKVVILAFLGFSVTKDSYELANTLPNIVFELLLGGVLASVAIPLLSRARNDPDGGRRYTQQLMTLMVTGLVAATVLATAAAPLLTRLYFSSGDSADVQLATDFAYLLLPQIFFYGVAALFGAILNTNERFAAPAWAPVVNNVVVIGVGVTLLVTSGTTEGGLTSLPRGQLLLLGLGTTAGIVIQALVMLPALRRSGFRFGWQWGVDARMREAGALMAWAVAYALVSQIGYVVIVRIAKGVDDGLYGLYTYGSMLFQLPYGILGVSLLTAIMPRMSRHAADGNMIAVKQDMSLANRLSTVALLPVTAAMIALAVPLAVVTSRYGSVTSDDARILALTLAGFAIGLLPLAITLVQMRVFYAMKDGRTPTLINAIMVAVRIPLLLSCLALPTEWVVPGLAASMSVSYMVGVAVGEIWLHARFGRMGFAATLSVIGRTAVASAVGGLAAWGALTLLFDTTATASLVESIGQLVIGCVVGIVVTLGVLMLLKVDEIDALLRRVRRLLGRGARRDGSEDRGTMEPRRADDDHDGGDSGDSKQHDGGHGGSGHGGSGEQGQESVTDQNSTGGAHGVGAGDGSSTGAGTGGAGGLGDTAVPQSGFHPGRIVGERYRLTRLIAVAADGPEFWLARDTVLPRDMAVTILPHTDPTSPIVTGTLRVGRLHHAGLPKLLDMGSAGTSSYLAGQWTDGASLTDLVAEGPLESAIAARMTSGLAAALGEVERSGAMVGRLHPSLVRVGMDGTVRLSHLVARPTATTNDDPRALGALTYLMLTATWPLTDAEPPAGLPPAPRRGTHELAASRVVNSASPELSRLAEQALRGSVTLDEIGHRAQTVGSGDTPRPSADRETRRPAMRVSAAAQTTPVVVRKDRRVKLAIAGTMLAALSVLIIIMVGSVTKQVLANIVAPIEAADNQELITVTPYTTTRTVAGTTVPGSGADDDSGATTETAEPVPVPIVGATVYDPQGEPPVDYESYVDQAFDGDIGTVWPTWVYRQQFGPGGIKDGVGLVLSFAEPVSPQSVTLSTTTSDTVVEIRSTDSANPALDATETLGSATLSGDPVTITLDNAPPSQYLVVWITQLAPYQGQSEANKGQFQSDIAEISVTG